MERHFPSLKLFELVVWLFIASHFILLMLCLEYAPYTLFYVQNILCIVYFLIILRLHHINRISVDTSVFVTVLVLWTQMIISFLAVGIDGGFQVVCYGTLCSAFFILYSSHRKGQPSRKPVLVEIGSVSLYLLMMILSQYLEPWYILEERVLQKMSFFNTIGTLIELLVFSDVYRMRLSRSVIRLQKQADIDELTGLLNRLGIRSVFDSFLSSWKNNAVPFAVAIFDIDDFKKVNDTYGHNAGDMVLKTFAEDFAILEKDKSAVCRWGGEEFLVLGQIVSDLSLFYTHLQMITEKMANREFQWQGEVFQVTVTCGVAVIESDMPIHELIDKADHRLYAGKANGKNQVVVYD